MRAIVSTHTFVPWASTSSSKMAGSPAAGLRCCSAGQNIYAIGGMDADESELDKDGEDGGGEAMEVDGEEQNEEFIRRPTLGYGGENKEGCRLS